MVLLKPLHKASIYFGQDFSLKLATIILNNKLSIFQIQKLDDTNPLKMIIANSLTIKQRNQFIVSHDVLTDTQQAIESLLINPTVLATEDTIEHFQQMGAYYYVEKDQQNDLMLNQRPPLPDL